MKKILTLCLCACVAVFFMSCEGDKLTRKRIQEDIAGSWKKVQEDGKLVPTNDKVVCSFDGIDHAVISAVQQNGYWSGRTPMSYSVKGTKVILENQDVHYKSEWDLSSLTNDVFSVRQSMTYDANGEVAGHSNNAVYEKVSNDFTNAIIGTWEGVSFEGEVSHGYIDHRWEFRNDHTYTYYMKEGDNWVEGTNTLNEYFVDCDFLAFRWKDADGNEFREMWDIESCNSTQMVWTALRVDANKNTYTTKFVMNKVH